MFISTEWLCGPGYEHGVFSSWDGRDNIDVLFVSVLVRANMSESELIEVNDGCALYQCGRVSYSGRNPQSAYTVTTNRGEANLG